MALLCSCHLVSDRGIADEIAAGACSVEDVQDRTGAGTSCGGCLPQVCESVERLLSSLTRSSAA